MPVAERARAVAAVWQRPGVQLFRASVIDEVRAPLDYRRVPPDEGTRRARAMLDLVGLGGIDERRDPMTLSGGEQQRLALAAALAQHTPVLVLDEATSALDAAASRRFGEALDRARAERGVTVVAIDHRPEAHIDRADRMIVLDEGRIQRDDAPARIFADAESVSRFGLRMPGGSDPTGESSPDPASLGIPTDPGHPLPALRLSGVDVVVRRAPILHALEVSLPLGAVAVVTGDNGAGKSTLLRLLATELHPASGTVEPRSLTRLKAGIGYAPQRSAELMLTGTVGDELCTALTQGSRGHDRATRRRAGDLLARAGLDAHGQTHPLRLSGGQRQRLAVALAVAGAPALTLLDEPNSAQDRAGTEHVLRLIADNRAHRVTIIATHDPGAFAPLATHRVRMSAGRIVSATATAPVARS